MNAAATELLKRLQDGNGRFAVARHNGGDVSSDKRKALFYGGQNPYAVIISCSDSRVAPEHIFDAGLGELFVIRLAGNVIDDAALGSVEYAVDHLGCELVVVLGHDCCGAVHAAVEGVFDGHVKSLTEEIIRAIGEEKDEFEASKLNVKYGVKKLGEELAVQKKPTVVGAVYRLESGKVDFII